VISFECAIGSLDAIWDIIIHDIDRAESMAIDGVGFIYPTVVCTFCGKGQRKCAPITPPKLSILVLDFCLSDGTNLEWLDEDK